MIHIKKIVLGLVAVVAVSLLVGGSGSASAAKKGLIKAPKSQYVKTPKSLRGTWYSQDSPDGEYIKLGITKYGFSGGNYKNGKVVRIKVKDVKSGRTTKQPKKWYVNGKQLRLLSSSLRLEGSKPWKGSRYVKSLYVSKKKNSKGYWQIGANNKTGTSLLKSATKNGEHVLLEYTPTTDGKSGVVRTYHHKLQLNVDNY